RCEVLERVVGQLLHQRHDGELAATCKVERVAVGRRTHHVFGADGAAGAAAALDDEWLAKQLGEPIGRDAPEYVGNAAWPIGHDAPPRLARPFLRMDRRDPSSDCGCEDRRMQERAQRVPPHHCFVPKIWDWSVKTHAINMSYHSDISL